MSATIKALEKRGVVVVEERRAWRGCSDQTTLSSASGKAPVALTNGQQQALAQIERARLDAHGDVVFVDGVTGSGKTEVYLSAIERVLAAGRSACVLVPEISLTAQTVGRFRSRFGETVAVFHSRLSAGERLDQWDMVASGAARVVVGARSALFCPLSDLGLIIIDEEHETSYKQGSSPRYHAREVAAEMARRYRCPLVLGSATPSAEALDRCRRGTYNGVTWTRVEMPERPGHAVLPTVRIADLRREFSHGSRSMFSKPLMEGLERVVERREKAVLLHNRRGFAPFLMCRECGCVPTCNHCSTALTYHERTHSLQCHTCGSSWRVQPYPAPTSRCPKCGSRYLAKMGLGTQQIEDALRQMLPEDVAIIRMDADSTRGKDAHKKLLEQFDAADCAVLLGTQMIAKGLDFPEVTLVGVVNADFASSCQIFARGSALTICWSRSPAVPGAAIALARSLSRPICPRTRSFAPLPSMIARSLPTTTWTSVAKRCIRRLCAWLTFWCGRRTRMTRGTTSAASQSCSSAAGTPPRLIFCGWGALCRRCWARLRV